MHNAVPGHLYVGSVFTSIRWSVGNFEALSHYGCYGAVCQVVLHYHCWALGRFLLKGAVYTRL